MKANLTELGRVRSLLFAPAVRPDFIAKLPSRGADAVVIDCEDATPPNAKKEARTHTRELTPGLAKKCAVTVRVNDPSTSWFVDDVHQALTPELTAVVVPKIESVEGMNFVAAELDRAGLGHIGVIAGIETALGVASARATLGHTRVVGAYFGAEDFVADMGGVRTAGNIEVLYARSEVVLAARLGGVPALDQVVTDFRDDSRFQAEADDARAMGYAGKLCIHPGQVTLANAAFAPTVEQVNQARRFIEAHAAAAKKGLAAIEVDGQMVDAPVVAQALRVLTLAGETD